jgi:exodeoxyribonuclease V
MLKKSVIWPTIASMLQLSQDQENALKTLKEWHKDVGKKQFITLGGYAGTGKTTLLSFLRQDLDTQNDKMSVAFCSFTGKATQVLKQKLIEHSTVFKKDFIGTIHSLIYKTIEDSRGAVIGWELRDRAEVVYDLIIVDEASMIDATIWSDLLSFGIPVIAVGDHGQLPPIMGSFNLMEQPQLRLEKIHRQAQDNPIIQLSILARERGHIPVGTYTNAVEKLDMAESGYMITLILCGYNNTRVRINMQVRSTLGFEEAGPSSNDRVICLRNNREKAIFNGMLGTLLEIKKKGTDKYKVAVKMDGAAENDIYEGIISAEQFGATQTLNNINGAVRTKDMDLFDFGYALTVHKAQGSQAKKVVIFEERFKSQDDDMWKRWLYTAVTRAEEELMIFGTDYRV